MCWSGKECMMNVLEIENKNGEYMPEQCIQLLCIKHHKRI